MKIQSKKNPKNVQTVTKADWEQMAINGLQRNFTIIQSSSAPVAKPNQLASVDYEMLLKKAAKLFKDENWAEAKKIYDQAAAIKKTKYITSQLEVIEAKLLD